MGPPLHPRPRPCHTKGPCPPAPCSSFICCSICSNVISSSCARAHTHTHSTRICEPREERWAQGTRVCEPRANGADEPAQGESWQDTSETQILILHSAGHHQCG